MSLPSDTAARGDSRGTLRIRQAVTAAIARWPGRNDEVHDPEEPVIASLSRRETFEIGSAYGTLALRSQVSFRAGTFFAFKRLIIWVSAGLLFAFGTGWDFVRSRNTIERRARRLRRTLERLGGTFLKLGQQMSIRIDLIPIAYCSELSKLLDRVPTFGTEYAIERIEASTGKKLGEIFRTFDPVPIGSASVACVYQGVLRSGERVAIKIRRPGIGRTFAADWKALSWLTTAAEFFALIRPGLLRNFLRDLETMFLEELDFRKEARYTDLFRRRAKLTRLRHISAPRVFFEFSNEEMLVTEFVAGVWLWELLGAVETHDTVLLERIRKLNIDPKLVARRLFEASLFGILENLIFHADPHPANVVIRPNSEITLIDFGACGSYTESQLHSVRQFHYCQANEDISGMVQCVLALLEPLPRVDIDELSREIEAAFSDSIQALGSPGSEWWERTSAGVWINFMKVARQYNLNVNLDTLRMIRSTLLYDTIAVRLDKDVDVYKEYRAYRRQMAKAARKRFHKKVRRFLEKGVDDQAYLRLEEMFDLGNRLAYRLQRGLDSPSYKFSVLAGKAVYAVTMFARWLFLSGLGFALGVAGLVSLGFIKGTAVDIESVGREVLGSIGYQAVVLVILWSCLRRLFFRLGDADP